MLKLVLLTLACALSVLATPDRESRILNGERASNTPFHVHVTYLNNAAPPVGFFGGGVLITDQHVLTVASNIQGFVQWRCAFGSLTHVALDSRTSTNAIMHPAYNHATRLNDVGIIVLPAFILLTAQIMPIALPPNNLDVPMINEQGIVYGFGFVNEQATMRSEFLMKAFKRVVPQLGCTTTFPALNLATHFCADDTASNICMGDLGGAFTTMYRQQQILTGLSSVIAHNCQNNAPSAYTRIATPTILDWIRTTTQVPVLPVP